MWRLCWRHQHFDAPLANRGREASIRVRLWIWRFGATRSRPPFMPKRRFLQPFTAIHGPVSVTRQQNAFELLDLHMPNSAQ
jgi:hypothetical protein